ncbi:unnamed protein product [Adineta ricciae]|uniref:TIL domain-containing protein n=1 Tax=Adineta ricciae TaxID=249248 RepID=A0A814S5L1_ADIRI|nr:unnamed protein product [Adineta ricciae]
MKVSRTYLRYFIFVLLISCDIILARRRRKLCDASVNEIFGSCANPCRQENCENRIYNTTLPLCLDPCTEGCICKYGHVRRKNVTDPCVKKC